MRFAFAYAQILWILTLLPLWWFAARPRRAGGLLFPRSEVAARVRAGRVRAVAVANVPRVLRALALVTLVIILAGPILILESQRFEREEVAIVLAIDLSSSMLAEDMDAERNRMEVARETAIRFVQARAHDRVGLVTFAGEALTRVPPTNDNRAVVSSLRSIDIGLLRDGTDIAGAIIAATNRLIEQPHDSRIIVLLTDGAHNAQGITPYEAADAAAANGVQIFPISILGNPLARSGGDVANDVVVTQHTELAREIETVLTQVARVGRGRYFHATDEEALDQVYAEIDRLATTSVALIEQSETRAVHHWFLLGAILLICTEATVRGTRWGGVA